MNSWMELLRERKSIRRFQDLPVDSDLRDLLLEAAFQSPSAGNQQMYSILDVRSQEIKEKLAQSCDHQPFIAQAPVVYIFCADFSKWIRSFRIVKGDLPLPGQGNLLLAIQDAVIAAQSTALAAESLGLGSCYIGDILEQKEFHQDLFKLPPYVLPITMLVIGFPEESQRKRKKPPRFSRQAMVFEDAYRELSEEELMEEMSRKAGAKEVEKWLFACCEMKYMSDFAAELNRSGEEYLREWKRED